MTRKAKLFSVLIIAVVPWLVWAGDYSFTADVISIADGDTITVTHDGQKIKIRLYGIDCPEGKQPYGDEAKAFTESLCSGRQVTLIVKDKDRYGRLVAEVVLSGGNVLNHEIVRAGYGWWYRKYAPDDQTLKALEAEARAAGRGLWADPNPIAPWDWRKYNK